MILKRNRCHIAVVDEIDYRYSRLIERRFNVLVLVREKG